MKGYITIIGCGKFGIFLAKHLREKEIEVQMVEKDENIVQANRNLADQIKIGDATKKKALEDIQIQNAEEVFVCIRSNMESSLLIVLNLKELGVKKIRAMAVSENHTKLLKKIGATDILNPDEHLAHDIAERINNPHLISSLLNGKNITKQAPPKDFIGKSLKELNLNRKLHVMITDIVNSNGKHIMPTGDHIINENDILTMLGPKETLEELAKKECRELPPEV